jgi:hypothetical protein
LQAANVAINGASFYAQVSFLPVVDGTFIIERPAVTTQKGQLNGVSGIKQSSYKRDVFTMAFDPQNLLFSITNAFEGAGFIPPQMVNLSNYISQLFPMFGSQEVEATIGHCRYWTKCN